MPSHPAAPWCIPGLWSPPNPTCYAQTRTCWPNEPAPWDGVTHSGGEANSGSTNARADGGEANCATRRKLLLKA